MQKTPEQIKIYAYLTPHPLDDFSGAEGDFLEWIPGFLNEDDDEEGITAIYRDCNIEIYDRIVEITEHHFNESVKTMWPLLSEANIKSMQIAIDIMGMIGYSKSALAGYMYDLSDHLKGNYVFRLDLNLLATYLKKNEEKEPLSFEHKSVWEHELIHLLDHKSITAASLYKRSKSPFENFKYYLIKYREEGVADLYYLLNGYYKINDIQEAIEKFKETSINKKKEIDFSTSSSEKTREILYEGYDFYTLGPWLILEYLKDYETNYDEDKIANCIKKIENKQAISSEIILEVIKKALDIKPDDFIYFVEQYFDEGFIPLI